MTSTPTPATTAVTSTGMNIAIIKPIPHSGQAIVLLHAFPLDHRMWLKAAEQLAQSPHSQRWGIVAVDLVGFGHSKPTDHAPDLGFVGRSVLDALAELDIRTFVLAGVSMSGYVAMEIARDEPEGLVAIALVDTKDTADSDEARARRLEIARQVVDENTVAAVIPMARAQLAVRRREDAEVVTHVESWIRGQRPQAIAWAQQAMANRGEYRDVTAQLSVPTLVIVGENDELSTPEMAREMADRIPKAQLAIIPDAGHLAAWEQPRAVAEQLANLITSLESGTADSAV